MYENKYLYLMRDKLCVMVLNVIEIMVPVSLRLFNERLGLRIVIIDNNYRVAME